MSFEIKNPWLMWVGTEHYPTIKDYVDEALELGVSKKIPSSKLAEQLLEPGTVVFLAHDEGKFEDCPECYGEIDCPDCRIRVNRLRILKSDVKRLQGNLELAMGKGSLKGQNRAQKAISKRTDEIEELTDEHETCEACDEHRKVKAGTGGHILLENGMKIDRRTIKYWQRHPGKPKDLEKHYKEQTVENVKCETCAATGKIPDGKVFGFFIPLDCEYVLKEDDTEEVRKEMEEKGIKVKTMLEIAVEAKRGCGYRKAGGFYAITDTEEIKVSSKDIIKELIEKGIVNDEGANVNGNFADFVEPISIKGTKRFRSIKRWSLNVDAEEELELAIEAME